MFGFHVVAGIRAVKVAEADPRLGSRHVRRQPNPSGEPKMPAGVCTKNRYTRFNPIGQQIAEFTLPMGHHADQLDHLVRLPETDAIADVRFIQVATFKPVHQVGNQRPGGDGVQAKPVAQLVGIHDRFEVPDP